MRDGRKHRVYCLSADLCCHAQKNAENESCSDYGFLHGFLGEYIVRGASTIYSFNGTLNNNRPVDGELTISEGDSVEIEADVRIPAWMTFIDSNWNFQPSDGISFFMEADNRNKVTVTGIEGDCSSGMNLEVEMRNPVTGQTVYAYGQCSICVEP